MNIILLLIPICIVVYFVAQSFTKYQRFEIHSYLNRWSEENKVTIHNYEVKVFWHPFIFRTSRNQAICKVSTIDEYLNRRQAWLKLGGYFLGFSTYKVTCKWCKKEIIP